MTSDSMLTSKRCATTFEEILLSSISALLSLSSFLPVITTVAPSCKQSSAVDRPMPAEAPVIYIIWFCSLFSKTPPVNGLEFDACTHRRIPVIIHIFHMKWVSSVSKCKIKIYFLEPSCVINF